MLLNNFEHFVVRGETGRDVGNMKKKVGVEESDFSFDNLCEGRWRAGLLHTKVEFQIREKCHVEWCRRQQALTV